MENVLGVLNTVLISYVLFLEKNKPEVEYFHSKSITLDEKTRCVFVGGRRYCEVQTSVCNLNDSVGVVVWNLTYYIVTGLSVFIFILIVGRVYSKLSEYSEKRDKVLNDRNSI